MSDNKVYGVITEENLNGKLQRIGDNTVSLEPTINEDGTIDSPFDKIYPWSEMIEVDDEGNPIDMSGASEYKGNFFIKVPKFYTSYTYSKRDDQTYVTGVKICANKLDNSYILNPAFIDEDGNELDYFLVGKYKAGDSGSLRSIFKESIKKDGEEQVVEVKPVVNITLENSRKRAIKNNTDELKGYQLMDIWMWKALQDLFIVEFATLDTQSVMKGNCNSMSITKCGVTNQISTKSGFLVESPHSMKYRGIEDLYGNVFEWLDGVVLSEYNIYVCDKPSLYSNKLNDSKAIENYTKINYLACQSENNILKLGYDENNPFIQFPIECSGEFSFDKGYYDAYTANRSAGRSVAVGGHNWSEALAGLFGMNCNFGSLAGVTYIGCRLAKRPIK